MADTVLGKVSLTPKGDYNAQTQYETLDVVSYEGGSYLSRKPVQGVTPGTDGESWMQLTAKGDPGEKGDTGKTGPQGKAGVGVPEPTKNDTGKIPVVNGSGDGYVLTDAYMNSDNLDVIFSALLDGKNTTRLFWLWWPLSTYEGSGETKYDRLERFAKMLANAWADKTYTLRFYNAETSSDSTGTPLDGLADGREAAPLLTDADEPAADWATEDPMTWYIRANATSLSNGKMNILALEGEEEFDLTGETAPVYCFSLATMVKEWEDDNYIYKSWRTNPGDGYKPLAGDVGTDNRRRWLTWHPAFNGGLNSKGGMTSGAGRAPMLWTSASSAIGLARKLTSYDALWTDCDQQFILAQWQLRHWTLSNSGFAEGCTDYDYQFTLAKAETETKRVLLTPEQAENFVPGSGVCLGERGTNASNDRNQSYNYDVIKWAKIISIETVELEGESYGALNLELEETIDTTCTMLVSTLAWPSGPTEVLPGHIDGGVGDLTSGKYPFRVAGIEMQMGAYTESLEPLWNVSTSGNKFVYNVYSCRTAGNQSTSTSNYTKTSQFTLPDMEHYKWHFIKKMDSLVKEAMLPTEFGGSSDAYFGAAFGSAGTTGIFCPWRGGYLAAGGAGGLPCANGNNTTSTSSWLGSPRLAGSGKIRGVYSE